MTAMTSSLPRIKKLFFLFLILPDWWQPDPVYSQEYIA